MRAVEALPAAPCGDAVLVALADAMSRYPVPRSALARPRRGRADGRRAVSLRKLGGATRVLPLRRRARSARVRGRLRAERPGRGRAATPRRSGSRSSRSTSCATSPRTGGSDASTCPRTSSSGSGSPRTTSQRAVHAPAWQRAHGAPGSARRALMRTGSAPCRCSTGAARSCVRAFAGIYGGLLAQMRDSGLRRVLAAAAALRGSASCGRSSSL